jgi:hypothetical protein
MKERERQRNDNPSCEWYLLHGRDGEILAAACYTSELLDLSGATDIMKSEKW